MTRTFYRLCHSHKMHLLALLGLFTDRNDTFPHPFINQENPFSFIYLKPEKDTPSGLSLTVYAVTGQYSYAPRSPPPRGTHRLHHWLVPPRAKSKPKSPELIQFALLALYLLLRDCHVLERKQECPSPKFFYFLNFLNYLKLNLIKITSSKKFCNLNQRRFFLEFFKNVQICGHFGTPFVLVFSRSMMSYDVL